MPPPTAGNKTTIYKPSEAAAFLTLQTTLASKGVDIDIIPDGVSKNNKNETEYDIKAPTFTTTPPVNDKIMSFTVSRHKITIQTLYKANTNTQAPSGYGMGTRPEDISAMNTTLQFHESRHGQLFLNYFSNNPLPVFSGKNGMTVAEFKAAWQKFILEIRAYKAALNSFNVQEIDCVGDTTLFSNRNQCSAISVPNPKP